MRRVRDSRQHLRGSNIGAAEHSDFSVGVRQCCCPLYRLVPIVRFVQKGIPIAFRGIPPTHILDDDYISTRSATYTDVRSRFVVGSTLQKNRKAAFGFGVVNVGAENYAIVHLSLDIALDADFVSIGSPGAAGKQHEA